MVFTHNLFILNIISWPLDFEESERCVFRKEIYQTNDRHFVVLFVNDWCKLNIARFEEVKKWTFSEKWLANTEEIHGCNIEIHLSAKIYSRLE